MKDIQKDPVQAGQAPMPKQDNTALKVVVIVMIVIFGFPLILIAIAFIFISSNWDRIEAWLDEHIDEWSYHSEYSDAEIANSARQIYSSAVGHDAPEIMRDDCWAVQSVLDGSDSSANRLMKKICDAEEMKVYGERSNKTGRLYFSESGACLELIFSGNFNRYTNYNYNNWGSDCGKDMTTVKLLDSAAGLEEDDSLEEIKKEQINV